MKTISNYFMILAGFLCLAPSLKALPYKQFKERPKLVLFLVIDQFRSDYLTRFQNEFLPSKKKDGSVGGFQYLMSTGAYFPYGEYEMLQDMTGPGHATIVSGAYPYRSGIPLNYWYDVEKRSPVYCAEDESISIVGVKSPREHFGTSPRNLSKATTVGDELKNGGYSSRVVSIALKDRAAIFMGGHRADLALWMDSETTQWVSSQYYLPKGELPSWVIGLNNDLNAKKKKKYVWEIPTNLSGLSSNPVEGGLNLKRLKEYGLSFPHKFEIGSYDSAATPLGLEWTVEAAKKAVENYQLGAKKHTDMLFVSFSSHDYVGHNFGPHSYEVEAMTQAEDKLISDLLNYLQKKVPGGLKNVAIVLTADHGIANNPEWLKANKIRAGRHDEKKMLDALNAKLKEKFGNEDGGFLLNVTEYNFYLNPKTLQRRETELLQIEKFIKDELMKFEGVAHVISYRDVKEKKLPFGPFEKQALRTYYPGRSGHFIVVADPNFQPGNDATTHMTGYNYDKSVPILFVGSSFKAGVYPSEARVVDIAPTVSFLLGNIFPTASEGKILEKAFVE